MGSVAAGGTDWQRVLEESKVDVAKAVDASLKVLVLYGFIGTAVSCLYPGHCATIWDAP